MRYLNHFSLRLRLGFSTLLLACTPFTSAHAGYDEGLAAYQRGQFSVALRAFTEAATRGDARAQRGLGLMHERGDGVPRDLALAAEWYRKALDQGLPGAQFNLAFVTPAPEQGASAPVQIATSRP